MNLMNFDMENAMKDVNTRNSWFNLLPTSLDDKNVNGLNHLIDIAFADLVNKNAQNIYPRNKYNLTSYLFNTTVLNPICMLENNGFADKEPENDDTICNMFFKVKVHENRENEFISKNAQANRSIASYWVTGSRNTKLRSTLVLEIQDVFIKDNQQFILKMEMMFEDTNQLTTKLLECKLV